MWKNYFYETGCYFYQYIASFDNTYQLLKNNGIQVIFWMNIWSRNLWRKQLTSNFRKTFRKRKRSRSKIWEVEKNYNDLKKLALTAKEKPIVLANEMYGDVWYLPGGKTSVAHFISDANAEYILKDNTDEKALTMSFEEVFAKPMAYSTG
jgi:iron complex transport system substrate-binding protein